jgi:hypothetical protein
MESNKTRMHAGLLFLLSTAYLFSGNSFIVYVLIYDFFVRIYLTPILSPTYILSSILVELVGFEPSVTDEYAKEFASHIGLTLLFTALFAELLNKSDIAFILILILALWKIFEVSKEVCIACKLYELLKNKNITLESL